MSISKSPRDRLKALAAALGLGAASLALAANTDLSNSPLGSGTGGATIIRPNIAFVFDDSVSMEDENMPDDASTNRSSRCWGWHGYNTLFYNPDFTYKPPYKVDGTAYSDGMPRYPDASFTAALTDGYFAQNGNTFSGGTNTTVNLSTLSNLSPSATTCDTTAGAGGAGSSTTITVSGSGTSTKVTSIKVGSLELLDSNTSGSTSTNTVASRIASSINDKNSGYTATASGSTVTIKASYTLGAITSSPSITKSGGLTVSGAAFSGYVAGAAAECPASPSRYYYSTHKTDLSSKTCQASSNYYIVTDPNKIEAPGIPDSNRSAAQIAAAKTNYANWYTYYRRRAYLLKAAAGEAFSTLDDSKYRIGLFFLNSVESGAAGTSSHNNNDLKINDFSGTASGTQRSNWYNRLYGARSDGNTPTRGALARMGRMFAGKISGWDPVQYSCQQNFTILSTDGYWNTASETSSYGPKKIDGTTDIGDQDIGPQDPVPATATLSIGSQSGSGSTNGCYRFTSLQAVTGDGNVELLSSSPVPSSCTTSRSDLGTAAQNAINARTATTNFKASWSNNVLTITSPVSLGGISTTPLFSVQKVSGSKSMSMTASAFSGFTNASTGAPLPYKDVLGATNSLADIAYYYWTTDLRTAALGNCSNIIGSTNYSNLCENNVFGSGDDRNGQQHMTLFTLGLGVSGQIRYNANYKNEADNPSVLQYVDIANGVANWPLPSTEVTKIDDLWHAAVNGRGMYFSTSNPQTLQEGIQSALAGVQARTGSAAAAATSNLEPVAGDNFVYVALYRTVNWDGDLKAFTINPDTGAISSASEWSAQSGLDAKVANATTGDGRSIKYFSAGATTKLKDFTQDNLADDGLENHFANICDKAPAIDQCGNNSDDLNATKRGVANDGENLVAWLRGASRLEMRTGNDTANQIFRAREHVMGDIVNAVPVYMKKPPFSYDTYDATYASFKTAKASRVPTVFAAANDGMLHAFSSDDGNERWAYVPGIVMSNLYKLADRNYAANHRYFADGSPTVADICTTLSTANAQVCSAEAAWKTMLVAGLNKGGCGYYALDVTDPANPRGLWEFTNANLGYSFGNPIVAKRKNGQWVVIFSSGYNNVPGNGCGTTGDGNGHVFVVDAATGTLLDDIVTRLPGGAAAGSTGSPSGLAKLNAWIPDDTLARADRLYGGDLLGNMWRFDFDDNHAPAGKEAVLLATLRDTAGGTGNRQPITAKPELAEISAGGTGIPVVLVGTGKYLGSGDLADQSQQSIYALKDKLQETGITDARGATMLARTLTQTTGAANGALAGQTIRTVTGAPLAWTQADREGWYMDLNPGNTSPGERVNVDMSLQFNVLTAAANVPEENACNVGGTAYLYFLDLTTGMNVPTAVNGMAGLRLSGNALVAGVKTLRLGSGKTVTVVTDTAGNVDSVDNPDPSGSGAGLAKRTAWREIAD
jgi:type IV pilus assembly protein PilY1